VIGPDRLLVGSDFPAIPREAPAGRTLRSRGLPDSMLDDITWYHCFRFPGISEPGAASEANRKHGIDARKLSSSRE